MTKGKKKREEFDRLYVHGRPSLARADVVVVGTEAEIPPRGPSILRRGGSGGKITGYKYTTWDAYFDGVKISHEYRLKDALITLADKEKIAFKLNGDTR